MERELHEYTMANDYNNHLNSYLSLLETQNDYDNMFTERNNLKKRQRELLNDYELEETIKKLYNNGLQKALLYNKRDLDLIIAKLEEKTSKFNDLSYEFKKKYNFLP